MQECLDAPVDTLVRMGEAAQNRVLARPSVDKQAAQLEELFQGVEKEP